MIRILLCILTSILLLCCKHNNNKSEVQYLNTIDSFAVMELALTAKIVDSIFLPNYADSVLKIIQISSTPASYRNLKWQDKKVILLDSVSELKSDIGDFKKENINGRIVAVGSRLPSFILTYKVKFKNNTEAIINLWFKNNGISIEYVLEKIGNAWLVKRSFGREQKTKWSLWVETYCKSDNF
ncbi:hypothetical protein [Niabella ginsengisoli]|uniref:Lipoprotein n=1 Tax=Niabella ginsengisoli TaxID=522298 RepID=A0ABS9SMD6_9BACT|nr:hypothetical protein [Niabella ginsengisoli]MCH5599500.1 hypothetical protein [Niabella ginsengisoli]